MDKQKNPHAQENDVQGKGLGERIDRWSAIRKEIYVYQQGVFCQPPTITWFENGKC
jgi:hypothetical protein